MTSVSRRNHHCINWWWKQKDAYLKDWKILFVNCLPRGILKNSEAGVSAVTKWEIWKGSKRHTGFILNSSYSPSSPYWVSKRPASLSLWSRFSLLPWVLRDLGILSLYKEEIPAHSRGFRRLMECKGISDMNYVRIQAVVISSSTYWPINVTLSHWQSLSESVWLTQAYTRHNVTVT